MEQTRLQDEFFLPFGVYLLNHSVGALTKEADKAKDQYFSEWKNSGSASWAYWLSSVDEFCLALSRFLGGVPEEYCPQENVSSALSKILSSLPQRVGCKKILMSDRDFPSMGFVLAECRRFGYELEILRSSDSAVPFSHWEEKLKSGVQMALFSHGQFGNSVLNPIKELTEMCRRYEIYSVVDIAQTAGVVPINVADWQADFIIGSCVKWLCGGTGAGFLWVAGSEIEKFQPYEVGWFSHENPMEFDVDSFRYSKSARRFWGGTPSIFPCLMAASSLKTLTRIGIENLYSHNRLLTHHFIEKLQSQGVKILTPVENHLRGGTVTVDVLNGPEVLESLKLQQIQVDYRAGYGIRVSPHIYNTVTDIDRLLDVLLKNLT